MKLEVEVFVRSDQGAPWVSCGRREIPVMSLPDGTWTNAADVTFGAAGQTQIVAVKSVPYLNGVAQTPTEQVLQWSADALLTLGKMELRGPIDLA